MDLKKRDQWEMQFGVWDRAKVILGIPPTNMDFGAKLGSRHGTDSSNALCLIVGINEATVCSKAIVRPKMWASPISQMYCFANPHVSGPSPQDSSKILRNSKDSL
jgi:hypothetical protein